MSEALDVAAVADAVAEATSSRTTTTTTETTSPTEMTATTPRALPSGWLLKESRSHPGYFYYYFIPNGLSSWHPPVQPDEENDTNNNTNNTNNSTERLQPQLQSTITKQQQESMDEILAAVTPTTTPLPEGLVAKSTEREGDREVPDDGETARPHDGEEDGDRASKRRKTAAATTASTGPKEVRVLHILKKHKDSRRPSSWRQAKITSTLEEAKSELESLLEILLEEQGNFNELKATFEELARTESDCSSAKRGGDLGFFGRRKMQPAFEEASFALQIGELTKQVVVTSSGVHLILRIG